MLKLNVGCAVVKETGYINIDLHCDADLKHDLRKPLPYKDGEIDEILASHILEHFSYNDMYKVLADWKRVLKDKGILHIRVPNLIKAAESILKTEAEGDWGHYRRHPDIDIIYGGQYGAGEYHHNGFTPKRLYNIMDEAGFKIKEVLPPRDKDINEINIIFKKRI